MIFRATAALAMFAAALCATAQAKWVRLDTIPASVIPAGVWRQMPAGAIFEIEPVAGRKGEYTLSLISSDDLTIAPGTYFGTMRQSAIAGTYDAELLLDPKKTGEKHNTAKKRHFTIVVDPSKGSLRFMQYKDGISINIRRLVPYLYRVSVKHDNTRPEGLDGAVRIAPESFSEIITL